MVLESRWESDAEADSANAAIDVSQYRHFAKDRVAFIAATRRIARANWNLVGTLLNARPFTEI